MSTFTSSSSPSSSSSSNSSKPTDTGYCGYTSANRPPAFIIGITGASASGKTSVCDLIKSKLPNAQVGIVSQDCFYRNLTAEEMTHPEDFDFDSPDAFDWELIYATLERLHNREMAHVPEYDYATYSRTGATRQLWNLDVVLFEGIFSFLGDRRYPERDYIDLRIFVETDTDTRLARRILRDVSTRGRTVEGVLRQYERFVKPSYDKFIEPQRKYADIIIPWGNYSENKIFDQGDWHTTNYPAIDMIVTHINTKIGVTCPPIRPLSPNFTKRSLSPPPFSSN